ncbi:MAG: tRNA pseudouridine(55) synthase TruB [Candidatus Zixiibacteriota bacterium]
MNDGMLLINKYHGITSFDVIARLRKILGVRRIGHCGTLDPIARGLILVCVGRATKLVQFLSSQEKEYTADILLGKSTNTFDRYGVVTRESDWSAISESDVLEALESFKGDIEQIVPPHSAVKYNGKPLYEYARKDIDVPVKRRMVTIRRIELLKFDPPHIKIEVVCSKGTYIRSLANDLGRKLGSGAHLFDLCRTRIGRFELDDALTLGQIGARRELGRLDEKLIALSDALKLPSLTVDDSCVSGIQGGADVLGSYITKASEDFEVGQRISLIDASGKLLAVGEVLIGSAELRMNKTDLNPVFKYIRVI